MIDLPRSEGGNTEMVMFEPLPRTNHGQTSSSMSGTPYVYKSDENKVRGNWTGRLDFILSCLSYAVGLGNVWRFPYQCYKNGGGAFVLPFTIMLFVTGIPLFFLESAFGQYASSGVISIWKACPLFQGIGAAMFLVSFFVSLYYNVIIAWTFYYLFASFTTDLPWASCGNEWNTPACRVRGNENIKNCTLHNGTWFNDSCYTLEDVGDDVYRLILEKLNSSDLQSYGNNSKSPSDEYFHRHVLDISEGFNDMGTLRWQIVLCLLLAWSLVCILMIKGIKSSGRAVYFTAIFPYLVLIILFIRGLTLPGSVDGIIYYLTPQWNRLMDARVWGDAAVQIFFSLAPGWGGLITLSSYNKFRNNCLRDAFLVSIGDAITSIFAGMVIFAILGFMANELSTTIDQVADEGAGLAFIVYPEVVTRLPASPLWAVMFFLMLITLGLGTQFAIVNTVHTTIIDMFPQFFRTGHRPSFLMIVLCLIGFFLGMSCTSQGGMYMLQLMDSYAATYSVLIIATVESLVLSWIYGYDRLKADIKLMLGKQIGCYWLITWKFVSPLALLFILIFNCANFVPTKYREYEFPWYMDGLGWCMTTLTVSMIPIFAFYKICKEDSSLSLLQKIKSLSKPTAEWGPGFLSNRLQEVMRQQNADSFAFPQTGIPLKNKTSIEITTTGSVDDYTKTEVESTV